MDGKTLMNDKNEGSSKTPTTESLAEKPTTGQYPESRQAVQSNNNSGDQWRYRFYGGQWWYWLPEGRWVYWRNGDWHNYNPETCTTPQSNAIYGYEYSPGYYSGYSNYPYYPSYGYYNSYPGYYSGWWGRGYYGSPEGRVYTGRHFYGEERGEGFHGGEAFHSGGLGFRR